VNIQNIPRDLKLVKQAFLPKRGAFSFFDYSQIEPRFFGYFTAKALRDDTVATWYREGRDVYNEIAGLVYGKPAAEVTEDERQQGKVWFLMSLYMAGPRKISETVGMSYQEAKQFYLQFHERIPQIKRLSNPKPQSERAMRFWQPGSIEQVYSARGFLKTPHGRHLHAEQFGEHKLLNKLIQGSAADLMKAALIRVDAWLYGSKGWGQAREGIGAWVTEGDYAALKSSAADVEPMHLESRMVSTIHDEIIFDGPESEIPILHEHVPPLMREDWLTEVIPIDVDHEVSTTTWADKIPYEEWLATQEVAA
jgi:DNA polymerase-1